MEIWKDVPDAPGYLVSDQGRVAKVMSPHLVAGYPHIKPVVSGRKRNIYVHHWVLRVFKGAKPFASALARHLNDDPLDNRAENLEWGSRSENQLDAIANGKRILKTHCVNGHALEGENLAPGRRCRTCQRQRARAQHARRKEVS